MIDIIPKGLDVAGFRESLLAMVGLVLQSGGETFVFIGRTPKGEIPVGLVLVVMRGNPYAEPHVVWFPEASARNRLELALAFLVELKRQFKVLLWVRSRYWKFFDHICKYGAIRTVGKYRGYFPDGEDAFLFQGVKN